MTETKYFQKLEHGRASSMVTTNTDYTSQCDELGSCFKIEPTSYLQANFQRDKKTSNILKIKLRSYTCQNDFRPKSKLHAIINKRNFVKKDIKNFALYLHVHPEQETTIIDKKKNSSTDISKTSVQYKDLDLNNFHELQYEANKGLAAFDGTLHMDNKVIYADPNIHSYETDETSESKGSRQPYCLEKERLSSSSDKEDSPKSNIDRSFVCNKSIMSGDRVTKTSTLGNGDTCDRNLDSRTCELNTKLSRKHISSMVSLRIPLSQRKKLYSKSRKITPPVASISSNVKKIYNCGQELSDKFKSKSHITIASMNNCCKQDERSENIDDMKTIMHEEVLHNFDSEFELDEMCTDTQSNGTTTTKVSCELQLNQLPQDVLVRSFYDSYNDSMCNNTSDDSKSECTSKPSLVVSRTDHKFDQRVIPFCNSSLNQNQQVLSERPLDLTNVNSSIMQIKKVQDETENIVICSQQSQNPRKSKIENQDEFDVKKHLLATMNSETKNRSESLEVNKEVTRRDLQNNLTNEVECNQLKLRNKTISVNVVGEGVLTETFHPSMTLNPSLLRTHQSPTDINETTLSDVLTDFELNNSHQSIIKTCKIVTHKQECDVKNNSASIIHLMCNEESLQQEQSKQQPNFLSSTTSRVERMQTALESSTSTRDINPRSHNDRNVQARPGVRNSRLLNRPRKTNLPQNGTTKYVRAKLTRLSNPATLQRDKTNKYSTVHCANITRNQQTNYACKLPFAQISPQRASVRPAITRLQKKDPVKKPLLISRCYTKTMKQTDQNKKLQLLPQYKQIIKHTTTTASHIVKSLRKQKIDHLHCQAQSDLCTKEHVSEMEETKTENDLATGTNSFSCEHERDDEGGKVFLDNVINDTVTILPASIDTVSFMSSDTHSKKFHSVQDLGEESHTCETDDLKIYSAKSDKSTDMTSNPISSMETKTTKTTPSFTATKGTLSLKDVILSQCRQRKLSAYYSQVIEMPSFSALRTESVKLGSCSASAIPGGYTSVQQCLNTISATNKGTSVFYVQHSSVCDGECEEAQMNAERCESESSFLTFTSVRTSLNNDAEGNINVKYCSSFVEYPQILQTESAGNIGMCLSSELVGSGFEGDDEQTVYSESKYNETISKSTVSANISSTVPSSHIPELKFDTSNYAELFQKNVKELSCMDSCLSISADSGFKRETAKNDSLDTKQLSESSEKLNSLTSGFKGHSSTEHFEKLDCKVQSTVRVNFKPNETPKKNRSCIADPRQKQFNTLYNRHRRRLSCGPIHVTDIHSNKSSRASMDTEKTSLGGNQSLFALHNTVPGEELVCTDNEAYGSTSNSSSFDQRKASISFPFVSSKEITCFRPIETLNKEGTKLNYVEKACIETDTKVSKGGIETFENKRMLAECTKQLIHCCSRRTTGLIEINENTTVPSLKMSECEKIHQIERKKSPLIETTRSCTEIVNVRNKNDENKKMSSLQNTEIIECTENVSNCGYNDLSNMLNSFTLTKEGNETSGLINSNYTQSSSKSSYSMNVTYNSTDNLSTSSGKPLSPQHLGTSVSLNSSKLSNTKELKHLLKSIVEKSISDCLLAVSKSMHCGNKKLSKTRRLDHSLFPCLKISSASSKPRALENLREKISCDDETRVRMFYRNKDYCSKPNNALSMSTDEIGYIPEKDNSISENKSILKRKKKVCRNKIKYKLEENTQTENVDLKNISEDSNTIAHQIKWNECIEGSKKVVMTSKSPRRLTEKIYSNGMRNSKFSSTPIHHNNKKSHHCTMLLSESKSNGSNFYKSDIPFISNVHLRKLVQKHIYSIPQDASKTDEPIRSVSESNPCISLESRTISSKRERHRCDQRSLKTRMLRPKAKTTNPYGSFTHGKSVTEKNKHSHGVLEKDLCIFGWTPEIASNCRVKEPLHFPIKRYVSTALLNCESTNYSHKRREDKNLCEGRSKTILNKCVDCVGTQGERNIKSKSSRKRRNVQRIISKSEETIQHSASQMCKKNGKCVGGGRKETLWAITRINTFHDGSRTYEVMEPSNRRPKHIPDTSHDIFVVAPSYNIVRF